ncbi:MAG: FixH family protein, partial [Moraxellaceae bacterium]
MTTETPEIRPWYRQFWPWFIMSLPAAAVVAGLTTVWIAVKNQDSVVRDDWYKDGKSINQSFARDDAARARGLSARFTLDGLTGEIAVGLGATGTEDWPATLTLALSHPTQAAA